MVKHGQKKSKYIYTTHPFERRPNGKLKTCTMQVRVWCLYNNCSVPEFYDIHHIDFNAHNNRIENLKCLPHLVHQELHLEARRKAFEKKQKPQF